ncbi:MAG: hypothetical protein AAGK32_07580 [Actinomycetota bacterium]
MTKHNLWPLVLALLLAVAACTNGNADDGNADGGNADDGAVDPTAATDEAAARDRTPITPGELTCEVTVDDSFFRLLYENDAEEFQRITGEVRLTLTNGGEHRAEVQSEAIRPGEILRESYFAAKPIGTTVADCTADELTIEGTEPAENGLDDVSECQLAEGDFGDFVFDLTATNSTDEPVYYNGQVAVRNEAGERIVTGFYLLRIEQGVIQYLAPGETYTHTFSALGALYSPGHTCELLSANRVAG